MKATTDLATGLAVIAGAAALYATGLPQDNGMVTGIAMDPAWYPGLLLMLAAGCGALLCAGAAVRWFTTASTPGARPPGRLVGGFGAIILYMIVFWYLGYWVATLLFVPLFSIGLGYRRPIVIAVVTLLVTALVWLVFTQALQIPLRTWPW